MKYIIVMLMFCFSVSIQAESNSIMNDFNDIQDAIQEYKSGNDEKGNRILEDLLDFHETTITMIAEVSFVLAKKYHESGDNSKASKMYLKALRMKPDNQEYIDEYRKFVDSTRKET